MGDFTGDGHMVSDLRPMLTEDEKKKSESLDELLKRLIAKHDGVNPEDVTLEYIRQKRGNCNHERLDTDEA